MANEIEFNGMMTKEEFLKLGEAVRRDGHINEAELQKLTNWVIEKRCGAACADLLFEGFLIFKGWDGDQPNFLPVEDEFDEFLEMEIPMLQKSRC